MNSADVRQFLYTLESVGWKLDLERMRTFLHRLGNPQQQFKAVHIAGTNGKGSVTAMVAAILQAGGFKTGMYTSPHLLDLRERIRINNRLITETQLTKLVTKCHALIKEIGCTFFEAMTGLAFYHFAEQKVDWVVVEVGLGGRLDATNLLQPAITAITHIGFDHMNYLGSSLESIAKEKAGIIKSGVPVIIGRMPREAESVLVEVAEQCSSPYFLTRRECNIESLQVQADGSIFSLKTQQRRLENIRLSLAGPHQIENGCTAVLIAEQLIASGVPISDGAIVGGLARVKWLGRWSIVKKRPLIICDVAHNADGMSCLKWMLEHFYHDRGVNLVLGVLKDKDFTEMAKLLPNNLQEIFVVSARTERSLPSADLAKAIKWERINTFASVAEGLQAAIKATTTAQLICVTGSHYVVGEALAEIKNLTK